MKDSHYNYPPTLASFHPIYRKAAMTDEIKNTIVVQTRINSSTKHILSAIRLDTEEENPVFKARDIYNHRAAKRLEELGPYSPLQAFMVELSQRDSWFVRYTVDGRNRITKLFFAKTSSQRILRLNYEVLLMDCTYKTNTYRLLLCIVSDVTPLNTIFYIDFCFMFSEFTQDYAWLLQMIIELYELLDIPNLIVIITDAEKRLIAAIPSTYGAAGPNHLLCLWHINKNIVVHCKKWYQTDEDWLKFHAAWQTVLYANTVEKFEENWNAMRFKFEDDIVPMDYLELEVVGPHKEKILRCYTNQIMHFGNTATSRSEGQNARLKAELQTSTGMQRMLIYV